MRYRDEFVQSAVEQFERPLVSYAAHITGDVERARDVVQETFLRLCKAELSEVQDHLAPWLYTVCRNLALDTRKKESRMKHMSDVQVKLAVSDDPPPSAVLEGKENADTVLAAIYALPANQQEAIHLKFHQGLRYREIGEVMKISASNVGFLIHQGINRLREKLSSHRSGCGDGGTV